MRREIDIRKRNKILVDQLNKKVILTMIALIIFLVICVCIYFTFIQNVLIKKTFEKDYEQFSALNENIPFTIQKIVMFSSATADSQTVNQSPSLDISQYCDIAIYLNPIKENHLSIQSLSLQNVSISPTELGQPCLYKKRIHDFGKCSFTDENVIANSIDFTVIDANEQIPINEDNYEIYNDGSTPITMGFYNKDIKKEFLFDTNEIRYNGTLLKAAFVPQSSIQCNTSFTLCITSTDGGQYICNINLTIPFENGNDSLYNTGYVSKTIDGKELSKFIRIQ